MTKAAQQIEELSRDVKRLEACVDKVQRVVREQEARFYTLRRHVLNSNPNSEWNHPYIATTAISTYLRQPGLSGALFQKYKADRSEISYPYPVYYVSQQFIDFVKNGNFGNGIALFFNWCFDESSDIMIGSDKPGERTNSAACLEAVAKDLGEDTDYVVNEIGVPRELALRYADPRHLLRPLIVSQFGTYPLLVSIFERYIRANRLEVSGIGGSRIRVDKNMKRWFGPGTNTHHIVLGTDNITKHNVTNPEFLADPTHDVHKNALELLAIRGGKYAYDGETFCRTMIYELISTFVIPKVPESVIPEPKEYMSHICAGVRIYITS